MPTPPINLGAKRSIIPFLRVRQAFHKVPSEVQTSCGEMREWGVRERMTTLCGVCVHTFVFSLSLCVRVCMITRACVCVCACVHNSTEGESLHTHSPKPANAHNFPTCVCEKASLCEKAGRGRAFSFVQSRRVWTSAAAAW